MADTQADTHLWEVGESLVAQNECTFACALDDVVADFVSLAMGEAVQS